MKKLFSISVLMLVFSACNKHIKDDYPIETGCEKYAGYYDMYDPINDVHYQMIISCESSTTLYSTFDSVHYENFANLFFFGHGVPSNGLGGTIIHPLTDKHGNRSNFSNVYYPDTLNRINVLIKDSIYLRLNIDNTAFWQEDSVPYQSITTVHPGLRIH